MRRVSVQYAERIFYTVNGVERERGKRSPAIARPKVNHGRHRIESGNCS
jgi:hypothetical protein